MRIQQNCRMLKFGTPKCLRVRQETVYPFEFMIANNKISDCPSFEILSIWY